MKTELEAKIINLVRILTGKLLQNSDYFPENLLHSHKEVILIKCEEIAKITLPFESYQAALNAQTPEEIAQIFQWYKEILKN